MLSNHLFCVTDQFGYIRGGDAVLKQDADESVAEAVWMRRLFPLSAKHPDLVEFPSPKVGGSLDPRRAFWRHERPWAASSSQFLQTMDQLIRQPSE
jgi:hypothetical protein